MQHFVYSLNPKSEHFLNLASKGFVMYKIVAEVRTILEKVLNSTQYTDVFDHPPEPVIPPKKGSHSTSFPLFPLHLHHT